MNGSSIHPSNGLRVTGTVISGLVVVLMAWSGGIKLAAPTGIPEHFAELGWSMPHISRLALLELALVVLYAVPRSSVFGTVLLTAYLGGAVAAHVRLADVAVAAFPATVIVAAWAGVLLRRPTLFAALFTSIPQRE